MSQKAPYWFKARKYGYGWTPVTLEGWVTVVIYIVVSIYAFVEVHKDYPTLKQNIIAAIPTFAFVTLILLLILYKKGEPLKWPWNN